jgi:hypothetical protein
MVCQKVTHPTSKESLGMKLKIKNNKIDKKKCLDPTHILANVD